MNEQNLSREELEEGIASIWREVMAMESIDVEENFFDVGGSSIMAIKIIAKMKSDLSQQITIANFFQYPSIKKCAQFLTGEVSTTKRSQKIHKDHRQVAIVGMAGKFPGANDLEEFWEMILNKTDGISFFKNDELDPSVTELEKENPNYIKARGYIPDIDLFDCSFFGMNPRTGELMDPQIRLMLEFSKRALDHSGNSPSKTEAKIGVFAGMSHNTYFINNVLKHPDKVKSLGEWNVDTLNEKDYVATQIAYRLGCNGPALSLHTACSTSLVAIIQAVKAIQSGDCDMAIAGGVNVDVKSKVGYLYQEGSIRSKDGYCKPFDKDSSGTIFCDGIGVVILKDLELAKKENDHIYAVMSGVGINNDGNDKVSLSAPSVNGQKDVIEMALADGAVDPETIGLFEAHGTATPVGDPIEIAAVTQAWNVKNHKAVLGSVKGNIGHTISAAGVAGFIKAVLSVENSILPATRHFNSPNPDLGLENTPFTILKEKSYWDSSLRRAAISSFGVGGTNAHVIIENYINEKRNEHTEDEYLPFPISAKSKISLEKSVKSLSEYIKENDISLRNISYTLCNGREDYKYRHLVFAKTKEELLNELDKQVSKEVEKSEILFAFPGQGAQYLGMGHSLYEEFEEYKKAVDYCCENLKVPLEIDLREILFFRKDEEALKNTFYTQPAIFVTEYALAILLESFGIRAKTYIGHSVGEFVAAVLANVMSLDDALKMISKRSQLMRDLPSGSMLSVRLNDEDIKQYLNDNIQLAAVNGPTLMVVAGPDNAIDTLKETLDSKNIQARKLHTSHAFHSSMMNEIVPIYKKYVDQFKLSNPSKKIYSTLLNKWVESEMSKSEYWAEHIAKPVLFKNGIDYLSKSSKKYTLIELGPRNTLVTLARMQLRENKTKWECINLLTDKPGKVELNHFFSQIGQLWELGQLKINMFHKEGSKVPLPEYCFDYRSLWLDSFNVKRNEKIELPIKRPGMKSLVTKELMTIIEDTSGFSNSELDNQQTFIALGFDSLLLTQVSLIISKHFNCPLTFRQLMDSVSTIDKLSDYVKENGDQSIISSLENSAEVNVASSHATTVAENSIPIVSTSQQLGTVTTESSGNALQDIINRQLDIMSQQVQMLSGQRSITQYNQPSAQKTTTTPSSNKIHSTENEDVKNVKLSVNTSSTAFGAQARISTVKEAMDVETETKINQFLEKYAKKTIKSKNFTQKYRAINSDPRVVSGFRPEIKEIIYSIVVNKSKAQHLWDIDGNEYVDMTCGFGSNFFGNQNPRINAALHDQLDKGMEIGPQHELVGECAELICEFTRLERAAFCNTGSEAVLGAIRAARAISGKTKVVMFTGSYHGINDEVIVRGLKDGRAMPAAAGISKEAVKDIIILEYGTEESYKRIEQEIGNIACVISETVQSRRPGFRPKEFLKKVRDLTSRNDVALIFDEVITGFRNSAGGAQEYFGIQADLATYGKIIGAGMSIGVIAGSKKYMDVLDGGQWQYGDDSTPTVGVTYFAGTFVRHPLALRAMREALLILKDAGESFYKKLNEDSDRFVDEVNTFCRLSGAPISFEHFGGVLKSKYTNTNKNNDLFFACMRYNGVHIWDGFPWYITMAHTEEDLSFVLKMFKKSVKDMQDLGIFPVVEQGAKSEKHFLVPPVPEARLGKDDNGNPAWFIEDKENPGEYLMIEKE
ncbi:aminotransferase class III-fold pyridoxal phosphate-dependent enzyme [Halobacteriovorax sp.]|uniref:aminotransferase class III-fold pyridoxal phosphate-dependent enzyme n=1 Tax=Halobacteriovorax sp. TaxID=2020862 RepID=UPI0035646567